MKKHRVLIVDDHPIIRRGLTQFLVDTPDIEVCGGAESVVDALQQVEATRPDLVLVDITLRDSHGVELIQLLKDGPHTVKMLVWSMFDEKLYAERVLRAGASGYINKQEPMKKVLEAMRQVLRGDVYLSPPMTIAVLRHVGKVVTLDENPVHGLTNRELEVFEMLGKGMTTKQIAGELGLSCKTVETHREKIKTRLNICNATQLTQRAVQWVLERT